VVKALEIAGVKNFIIPWSDHPHGVKRIGHKLNDARGFLGRQLQPSGGTYEAPALVLAHEMMERTSSPGKILITVTDGQTEWPEESKALIADMVARGTICIGIGINGYDPVQYPVRLVVDDTRQLATEFPKLLTRIIRRGQ
jgi:hypothetical protein